MKGHGSPFAFVLSLAAALTAALVVPGHQAVAQPFPEKDVPPALRGWVPWALDGARDRVCPVVGSAAVCLWPGRIALKLGATGGTFAAEAWAERPLFLPLPGDAKVWPQEVRLDGKPVPVVPRDERPAVLLPAGRHRVDGRLLWSSLPDSLAVPPEAALLDLAIDGRPVPLPRREESGLLLLRQEGERAGGGEELRVKVFRRLEDGIPLFLETRLLLEVSGKAREDLDRDEMLLFALVRAVEVLGEAASKVSLEARAEVPAVRWAAVVGMRNRLIHAYFDVDRDILWATVSDDLPGLKIQLSLALAPG